MSLTHEFLDIFVLAVAVLDLGHHYHAGTLRVRWIISGAIGLVLFFGGDVWFDWFKEKGARQTAQERITAILQSENPQTFIELSHGIPFPESMVYEALHELVERGSVVSDDVMLAKHDDSNQHVVRLYRTNKTQIAARKEKVE